MPKLSNLLRLHSTFSVCSISSLGRRNNLTCSAIREFLQGDEKNIAEVIYKSKLSKIPCKHLQQSHDSDPDNLWCPFGKSCFYQHNHPETGDKVDFAHTHEESLQRMKQSRERRRMREEWMSGDLALESILRRMVAGHYHDWDDVEADLRREYESDEFDDEEEDVRTLLAKVDPSYGLILVRTRNGQTKTVWTKTILTKTI